MEYTHVACSHNFHFIRITPAKTMNCLKVNLLKPTVDLKDIPLVKPKFFY